MRDYGKLYCRFWTSPDIQSVSDGGKILAAYLLTCSHSNLIGCFYLPLGYICDDLKWKPEKAAKVLTELQQTGFVSYDAERSWLLVRNYLEWNPLENPNQVKAAEKIARDIPHCAIAGTVVEVLEAHEITVPERLLNGSETLSKPVTVAVAVTVPVEVAGTVSSCAEPEKAPGSTPEPVVVFATALNEHGSEVAGTLPLIGGDRHPVRKTEVQLWTSLYPGVEVLQELRNMQGWLLADPARRKTPKGINRFITNWLSRSQNRSNGHGTTQNRQSRAAAAFDAARLKV